MTREQIEKADAWRIEHKEHVARLTKIGADCYAPSGSDINSPELWKPEH